MVSWVTGVWKRLGPGQADETGRDGYRPAVWSCGSGAAAVRSRRRGSADLDREPVVAHLGADDGVPGHLERVALGARRGLPVDREAGGAVGGTLELDRDRVVEHLGLSAGARERDRAQAVTAPRRVGRGTAARGERQPREGGERRQAGGGRGGAGGAGGGRHGDH